MREPHSYGTSKGIPVTEELIEGLSREAEDGYEARQLVPRKVGRPLIGMEPSEVVPVRLDSNLRGLLADRAERDATSVSDVIRRALKEFFRVA